MKKIFLLFMLIVLSSIAFASLCEDSDGGINPYIAGTTSGLDNNNDFQTFTDSCVSGKVVEHYCCPLPYDQNLPWNQDPFFCEDIPNVLIRDNDTIYTTNINCIEGCGQGDYCFKEIDGEPQGHEVPEISTSNIVLIIAIVGVVGIFIVKKKN